MIATELITRRTGSIEPKSFDAATQTLDVCFSTGSEVIRSDFEGEYIERLSMSPESVDLSQLRGAPVLDNHDRFSGVSAVLGVVEEAKVDGVRGMARIRLSSRPELEGFRQDVKDGIVRSISAGYSVEKWEISKRPDGMRIKTAMRWTPKEISFTALGADPGAKTRTQENGMTITHADKIRTLAAATGVPVQFAENLLQRNLPEAEARSAVLHEAARLSPVVDNIRTNAQVTRENSPDWMARAAGEALYARVAPGFKPSEHARQFAGRRFADIARLLLVERGLPSFGSDAEVITRSLNSTSDLANVVAVLAGKIAGAAYEAAPSGVRVVCKQGTPHNDFRGRNIVKRGELPMLEKVNESGEFRRGSVVDDKQGYKVETFGKVFGMTRQLLVNDDLGVLADIASGWGLASLEFENQQLVDTLTLNTGGGPKLSDNKNLFHADHGNLAASGGAISDTTLSAGRLALRSQKGLSGQVPINAQPKYLLVPAALETAAEKWLAPLVPAQASNVNPFSGENRMELVVDPRLDAKSITRWYIFADPVLLPVVEFAYLAGFEGLQVETRNGFDVDGVEIKARLDFGAGAVDHRGAFANPGA